MAVRNVARRNGDQVVLKLKYKFVGMSNIWQYETLLDEMVIRWY